MQVDRQEVARQYPKKSSGAATPELSFCVERMTISSFTVRIIISHLNCFVNSYLETAFVLYCSTTTFFQKNYKKRLTKALLCDILFKSVK